MDWLTELTTLLGVHPFAFIALTALVIVFVAIARRMIGNAYEGHEWWKAILSTIALGCGIGGAFVFEMAGLYKLGNPSLVAVTGLFNGSLAIASHQLLKHIPWLDKWLKGVTP